MAIFSESKFKQEAFSKLLAHGWPYFKISNFNFEPGKRAARRAGHGDHGRGKGGIGVEAYEVVP